MGESRRDFGCYAERFLGDYLTAKKGCSAKAVSSYRDAIVLPMGFTRGRCGGRFGLAGRLRCFRASRNPLISKGLLQI